MGDFKTDLADYICSGHALLHVETFEKDRGISEIAQVAEANGREIYIWSVSQGWRGKDGKRY